MQRFVQRAPSVQSGEFVEWALRVRSQFGLTAITAAEHMLNCTVRPENLRRLPDEVREKLRRAPRETTPFEARDATPLLDPRSGRSAAFHAVLERCTANGSVSLTQARAVLPAAFGSA